MLGRTAKNRKRRRGALLPLLVLAALFTDGGGGDPDPEPKPEPDPKPDPEKTFTREELNGLTGKARSQARQALLKELQEELGMTVDEAKRFVKDRQDEDRQKLDEHDRLKLEAEETLSKAQAELAKANAATLRADVVTALNQSPEGSGPLSSDLTQEAREMAVQTALSKAAEAPDGEDPAAFGSAFVRAASPAWFSTSGGQPGPGTPPAGGTPGGSPKGGKFDAGEAYQKWKGRNTMKPLKSNN